VAYVTIGARKMLGTFGHCVRAIGLVSDVVETAVGSLSIRVAAGDDARAVLRLRDDLAAWMVQRRIDLWQPGEMPLTWVEHSIAQGWVHTVWKQGELVGSVTVAWQEPFVWGASDTPAGYIHMLMVDRAYAGNGVGRSILGWAEGQIAASGRRLARLDCATSNGRLCGYYEQAGYVAVGRRRFRLQESKTFPAVDRAVDTTLYEKGV
jgi:ribosomal protein S18 acetylase RimI-like enzyme